MDHESSSGFWGTKYYHNPHREIQEEPSGEINQVKGSISIKAKLDCNTKDNIQAKIPNSGNVFTTGELSKHS